MSRLIIAIITRTGNTGTTGVADGNCVAKSHQRIRALGNFDELNTVIGALRSKLLLEQITNWIELLNMICLL